MIAGSRPGLVDGDADVLAGRRPVDALNDEAVLVDEEVATRQQFNTLKNKSSKEMRLNNLRFPANEYVSELYFFVNQVNLSQSYETLYNRVNLFATIRSVNHFYIPNISLKLIIDFMGKLYQFFKNGNCITCSYHFSSKNCDVTSVVDRN